MLPFQMSTKKQNGVSGPLDPTAHEEEPNDLDVGISIQELTKIYESVSPFVAQIVCILLCLFT